MKDKTRDAYRRCFGSNAGRNTLGMILLDGGFFDDDLNTPEAHAKRNFAASILKEIGVIDISNIRSFVNKLFEIPVPKEKRE